MSDAIYVLLTLAVFILLSLLVGVLDRHLGASEAPDAADAEQPVSDGDRVGDRGAK